jgi:hypothetical protein
LNQESCKRLVFARAGGRCERCGAGITLSYHHRKKRSQGGDWTPDNIVLVCGSGTTGCHGWIEHNPAKAEKEGFHVRPWEEPDEIAVKILRQNWQLLLDNGEVSEGDERGTDPGEEDDLATDGGELLRGSGEQDIPDPVPSQE